LIGLLQVPFQIPNHIVMVAQHPQIRFHGIPDSRVGKHFSHALAIAGVLQFLGGRQVEVVLV